jgi:hypothetical protein
MNNGRIPPVLVFIKQKQGTEAEALSEEQLAGGCRYYSTVVHYLVNIRNDIALVLIHIEERPSCLNESRFFMHTLLMWRTSFKFFICHLGHSS